MSSARMQEAASSCQRILALYVPAALLASASVAADAPWLQATSRAAGKWQKCSAITSHSRRMHCGRGVPLCGVLTLETGDSYGAYSHDMPVVHGLWPEVSWFGDSECLAPRSDAKPKSIYPCYNQDHVSQRHILSFESHEWYRHGKCAGVASVEDFFTQVCTLASGPLQVMYSARKAGLNLADTANALQKSGFCVWGLSSHSQIELSACAGPDGRWQLADVGSFEQKCGHGHPTGKAACRHGHHGPRCRHDADCLYLTGCHRCAHSGFCTDIPWSEKDHAASLESALLSNISIFEDSVSSATKVSIPKRIQNFLHGGAVFGVTLCALMLVSAGVLGALFMYGWRSHQFERHNFQDPLLHQQDCAGEVACVSG